jgi:tRNA threonylcarbamoyladenosine biosynthesis protein TsaB
VKILAIDTATAVLSAALGVPGGVRYVSIDAGPRHSELLMDTLQGLIASAGIRPGDLNLVACMRGPGSFTGLRIGFATAKGISLSLGIPLVTVPTLDCMAASFSVWPGIVVPGVDAKRGCFFTALYRRGERISGYMDASPGAIAEALTGAAAPGEAPPPVLLTGPDAELLLPQLAALRGEEGLFLDPARRRGWALELFEFSCKNSILTNKGGISDESPLYLRKSDAELRREAGT